MADVEDTVNLSLHKPSGQEDSFGLEFAPGTLDLRDAAETVALGRAALVVDNDAVHGIVVDGQQVPSGAKWQVRALKSHGEDGKRPYGLIIPHRRFAELVDVARLDDQGRELVNDPDFVSRLGAIAFIRVPADAGRLEDEEVPACAMSVDDQGKKWIQNYEPEGGMLAGVTGVAEALDVRFPVITSLNRGGEPETVDPTRAYEMVDAAGMAYLTDPFARRRVRGSYPIIQADERGLRLVREGCLGISILKSLLDGYELEVPADVLRAKHPTLEQDDVPELQGLKGSALRDALIAYLGWGPRAPLRQVFRPAPPPMR